MEIIYDKVSYIYNKGLISSNKAIDNINIALNKELMYGIIGKSGSGKTTFIQLLNGLLVPSIGEVKVDEFIIKNKGKIININSLRKRIGLIFQFPEEQFFETTVEKEISFALNNFKCNKDKKEQIIKSLTMVGLDESYLNKNPFMLSNGEKRRIAIASILVYKPDILVLDEPTVGLDYKNKKIIMSLLERINKKYNKTIIIISHDIDMLYLIVDNIIVFENGRIILSDTKDEVFKKISFLKKHDIDIPKILEFTNKVLEEKNIKLGNYNDVKDLIKAVYRNV